ncbi:DNA-binding transcriptional LysR family regulator [Rhodococcus wratislaviensis]|uniref:LysR family transcriptional regulator n=2 Tax=Rhodococcus TaxID=1827 RepID=A0AB38F8N4_RHOWR|nr:MULTISPECIES: LysR family transcriptional regulator [Rhodococcus]AII05821.1 LysR family transcriptional regulator [Rhodococcus opacus]REE73174.1 DNA-binding transcriptional LysR family regulator [Rhodococcus wratislaviensis]SPZ37965.1 LysR family transcriptional regulator [Rhodococcus wratislaviensis]
MQNTFDVVTLFLLLDIADAGSLTGGAEQANMTPSAASQRIAKLEQNIRQPVLTRLPRGVRLTEAGEILAARARLFRREMRAARGDLEALRGLESGTVRLGSFPTVSASLLSDALKDCHARWPGIDVRVHSAVRPRLLDMLRSSEVELALLWSYAWTEETEKSLSLVPLMEDQTQLLVPADGELAQDDVAVASLRGARWIIRNADHPAAEVLYRSCEGAGFTPDVVYEAHDYQEIEAMVAAGMGIAMVPRLAVAHHRPDVRAVRFRAEDRVPTRSIYIASLARREYTPSMYAISRALHEAAQRIAGAAD